MLFVVRYRVLVAIVAGVCWSILALLLVGRCVLLCVIRCCVLCGVGSLLFVAIVCRVSFVV